MIPSGVTRRPPCHTRKNHWLSQSKGFGASFGQTFRRKHWLSQSHPLVGLSLDGLSLDGSSLRTEMSAQPITSISRIIFGWTFFGRTFFGRIILRSETLKIITSHKWSRTARVTRSRSLTLVRHVIKRDGRKRRKRSLYAQKPYVYVRLLRV